MPLKLSNHWAAIEMNLIHGSIIMYDSLKMTTHESQENVKLTLFAYVLLDVLRNLSWERKE